MAAAPEPGRKVKVKTGPFRDFVGKVATVDSRRQTVRLGLSFYLQPMLVELELKDIKAI
jgi:transcription antitermination factor NusG